VRSTNKRSDDFRRAAANKNGKFRNRNHTIKFFDGCRPPNFSSCKHCELALRCAAGKRVTVPEARDHQRECYTGRRYIDFSYHGSICLRYDIFTGKMSDLGMWGYSETTSRAIRWYVEALVDNGYIAPKHLEPALKWFKKKEGPYNAYG